MHSNIGFHRMRLNGNICLLELFFIWWSDYDIGGLYWTQCQWHYTTKTCVVFIYLYRTRVWSLANLVSNWLTRSVTFSKLDWCDPSLLMLLLLLTLIMRIVLATVCCRFGSWGLVIKCNFCSAFEHFVQDFELQVQARFWTWSLVSILLLMFGWGYEVESWSIFWS